MEGKKKINTSKERERISIQPGRIPGGINSSVGRGEEEEGREREEERRGGGRKLKKKLRQEQIWTDRVTDIRDKRK